MEASSIFVGPSSSYDPRGKDGVTMGVKLIHMRLKNRLDFSQKLKCYTIL